MEKEQTTSPVPTEGTNAIVSAEEQEILDELAAGSGEQDQGSGFQFIPYITVNNQMVLATVDGREVKFRCKPEFNITTKEGQEYKTEVFMDKFEAVILKFMHRVQRKLKVDQKGTIINEQPFFRSLEFRSFSSKLNIRQNGDFLPPVSYAEYKEAVPEDERELWSVVYFIIPGENMVRKAEFKGASRGVIFDYTIDKKNHPVAGTVTEFSLLLDNESPNPYNKLVLTNLHRKPENLVEILGMQKELNIMIDSSLVPSKPAKEGTVIAAPKADDGEIKVGDGPVF